MNMVITGVSDVVTKSRMTTPDRALILMHGRGASASSIMRLTEEITLPNSCAVLAPQATTSQWYPQRFIVPQAENEPALSTSLTAIDTLPGATQR
jgi:phospholipase/carboxylesterase